MAKFRAEKSAKEIKDSGAEPYCPEEALSDNDDSEQSHINKHVPSQGECVWRASIRVKSLRYRVAGRMCCLYARTHACCMEKQQGKQQGKGKGSSVAIL